MYKRPVLCRLCECPVLDTGVRVADLDLAKLSLWWLQQLETELDDDDEALDSSQICQFCLCDAKLKAEGGLDQELLDCDWWTGHDINQFYFEYYDKTETIQPCFVRINPLKLNPGTLPPVSSSDVQKINSSKNVMAPKITECIFCREVYGSRREAYRHVISSHKDKEKYHCSNCFQVFQSKEARKIHLEKTHKELRCHKCAERFRAANSMWNHILDVHHSSQSSRDFVKCCKQIFKSRRDLVCHFLPRFAPKLVKCIYCNKLFKRRSIHLHVKNWHSSVAIKCYYIVCPKYFFTEKEMQQHILIVHESRTGLAQCPYCPQKLERSYLSGHILLKHASIALKCTAKTCAKYFHSENERTNHISKIHPEVKVVLSEKIKCFYCEKHFMDKNLKGHIRSKHVSEELIICPILICRKYFKCREDCNKHVQLRHAGDDLNKIFNCENCEFKTSSKWSLEHHINKMHGTEHLKCEKCAKVFKSSVIFSKHKRNAHTRKKCPHCKETFNYLNAHTKVVPCIHCKKAELCRKLQKLHQENCPMLLDPDYLKCKICSKSFTSKLLFTYHESHAHKTENCPHCKKHFAFLQQHFRPVPCKRCQKVAPCRTLSRVHYRKCSSLDRVCVHCKKLFTCLKQHLRSTPCRNCHYVAPCRTLSHVHCSEKTCSPKKQS